MARKIADKLREFLQSSAILSIIRVNEENEKVGGRKLT